MANYVIYDYTNSKDPDVYKIRIVSLKELFDEIDEAREDDNVEIAVYEIGDCLLDWS